MMVLALDTHEGWYAIKHWNWNWNQTLKLKLKPKSPYHTSYEKKNKEKIS